jgi:small subunit ribosomal protein S2
MNELLEAGVHFGHKTQRWNPKMSRFIFGVRNEIHIFDLQHTVHGLYEATAFLSEVVGSGGRVIYVGTKRQAKDTVKVCAEKSGQYCVTERWLGGTLTNFNTIKTRLQRLRELRSRAEAGEFEALSKRDAHVLNIEMVRLERKMGGIANMTARPEAIVVVDPRREHIAVHEARVLGIPVVGLTDSNCDPDDVDIIIPGNDDSIRSVRLVLGLISSTVAEAFESYESHRAEREEVERAERERLERVRREMALKQQDPVGDAAGTATKAMPKSASAGGNAPAAKPASAKPKPAATATAKSSATAKPKAAAKPAGKVAAKSKSKPKAAASVAKSKSGAKAASTGSNQEDK